ncbi:hypothetical protein ABC255_26730 [Neobacillus sp. 3P2-tot-E-2]|uniref:hypothetical protein n=1 Tax=Neobacillus sp. 3P2-tot-E-2 TaxID=3132212 RepID=UPI0039A3D6E7
MDRKIRYQIFLESMAGILIYTATPDAEGSLGGLFHNVLWKALNEARLCSGDPLCAEHTNRFLDRSLLVKTVSNLDVHYFK